MSIIADVMVQCVAISLSEGVGRVGWVLDTLNVSGKLVPMSLWSEGTHQAVKGQGRWMVAARVVMGRGRGRKLTRGRVGV